MENRRKKFAMKLKKTVIGKTTLSSVQPRACVCRNVCTGDATTTPGMWIRKDQNDYMRNTASTTGASSAKL